MSDNSDDKKRVLLIGECNRAITFLDSLIGDSEGDLIIKDLYRTLVDSSIHWSKEEVDNLCEIFHLNNR